MKKFFGILILIIGVFGIGMGIVALTDLGRRNSSFEGQIGNEFSESYNNESFEQQAIGLALIGSGLIFSILGVIMIASKSKKSKSKISAKDNIQIATIPVTGVHDNFNAATQTSKMDDVLNRIERLGKLKEQGLITEEEFQEQKKKCFA
jgi:uncharacterized alpha/beta hydrolase family protein